MQIPVCYEATRQFDARDRAETAAIRRRPRCQCCGKVIQTETVLDLQPFGIAAFACQRCVDRFTRFDDAAVC